MAKKTLTISDAVQGYMMRCQSKGYTLKTRQWYEQKLRYFCSYMESQQKVKSLKDVTLLHLRSFIVFIQNCKLDRSDSGGIKPRKDEKVADLTVKGYVQVIKGFFTWCISEELLKNNPASKLERPKVASYLIPTFTEDQINMLLSSCNLKTELGYRDYTIMLLLLDTGIRVSELCGLQLQNIHKDYIKVFGKGRKEREVGLHSDTVRHLWKYVHMFRRSADENDHHVFMNRYGKPLTPSGVAQLLVDVGKRANIEGVRMSAHTFRHTFAVMYLMNGGDVYSLSRLMGHSEIQITETYLKDFQSREARKNHQSFSPLTSLKQSKKSQAKKSDSLFN